MKVPPPPTVRSSKTSASRSALGLQPIDKTSPHGIQAVKLEKKPPPRAREEPEATPTGLMGPREESGLRFPQARMERSIRRHWVGEVVGAILPGAHEPVQVLALPASVRPSRKDVERCVAAGRGTAKVRGHGVASFVEVLRLEDGRLGIATEPIEGECLADGLQPAKMQLGRAVGILRQLAHVMRLAEKARLAHGTLCVDSVWLTERDGRADAVVVTDFGLEALMEPHLQSDEFDAPHRPYSPDRLLGLDRGREDIYLFGCVAHHVLAGRPVFEGARKGELRRSHSIQDVPPIRRIASSLLGPLAVIVDRCLANDSNERFEDFDDVEAALCLAQVDTGLRTSWDDLPLPAIPSSSRKRVDQFFGPRREKAIVAVGGALATPMLPIELDQVAADPLTSPPAEPPTPLPSASLPAGAAAPVTVADPTTRREVPMWTAALGGVAAVALILLGLYFVFGRASGVANEEVAEKTPERDGTERPDEPAVQEAKAEAEAEGEPASAGTGEGERGETEGDTGAAEEPDTLLLDPAEGPIVGRGPSRNKAEPDAEEEIELEEGEESGNEAIESSDQSVSELLTSAARARKTGQTSKAIKLYKQVLVKDPKNKKALPALGDLYFNRSDYQNAAKYFRKAVGASPGSASHRLSLGDAYYKLGRYTDAKKQYEQAKAKGSSAAAKRIDKVNKKLGG